MSDVIHLTEYQPFDVVLDDGDVAFIQSRLTPQINLQRALSGPGYTLNPNQFVGVVTLPSGRLIQSTPKVPLRNLFLMLAIAYDLDQKFRDEVAGLEQLDELLEFVVAYFIDLVETRLTRGLYRNYVEMEENLSVVRGRILGAADLQRNAVLRHRTYCQYSEFTHDIAENQVIRQVVHHLTGWVRNPKLRHRLWQVDATLAEVRPTNLPVRALDLIRYHRLNDDYIPIHRLCRLFLQGASLQETTGPIDFRTFLIDMNALFEIFVARILFDRAGRGLVVEKQAPRHLDHEHGIEMFIDLLVARDGQPLMVADTKYKRASSTDLSNADLYQVFAYCQATGARAGLLIYPKHELAADGFFSIVHSDVGIRRITINLDVEANQFDLECHRFANRFFALAEKSLPSDGGGG